MDLLNNLKMSILNFTFAMIYIIYKMLVLLKNHRNFLKKNFHFFKKNIFFPSHIIMQGLSLKEGDLIKKTRNIFRPKKRTKLHCN